MNLTMLKAADPLVAEGLPEIAKPAGGSTENGGLFAELLAKLAGGAAKTTVPTVEGKSMPAELDASEGAVPEVDGEADAGAPTALLPEDLQVAATPLLPAGTPPTVASAPLNPAVQFEAGTPAGDVPSENEAVALPSTGASTKAPPAMASAYPQEGGEASTPTGGLAPVTAVVSGNAVASPPLQAPQPSVAEDGAIAQETVSRVNPLPVESEASVDARPAPKSSSSSPQAIDAPDEAAPFPVRAFASLTPSAPVTEAEVSTESAPKPATVLAVRESAPVVAAAIKPVVSKQESKGDAPSTTAVSAPPVVEEEAAPARMPEAKSVPASTPPEPEPLLEGEAPVSRDEPPITARQQTAITVRAFAQAAIASLEPHAKEGRVDTSGAEPVTVRGMEGIARPEAQPVLSRESSSVDGAARAASLPDPVEVPVAELGRFAVRGVRQLLHEGEQRMTLKVVPESLGEVRIEVTRQGGEVQVRMSATTQAVREMLEGQAHTLREALVREGFDSPRIQFTQQPPSSSGGGGWSEAGSQEAQQQPGHSHGNGARHGGHAPRPETSGSHAQRPATASGGGALNVTV